MLNEFLLITKIRVARITRRTLFFSMMFALSACDVSLDSSDVAIPDDLVADLVDDVVDDVADVVDDVADVADVVVVDLAVTALAKIQSYAIQGTVVPTVADYKTAGITGVNGTNLSVTNALIKASDAAAVNTQAKIQAIANQSLPLIKIQSYATQNTAVPAVADYTAAGITAMAFTLTKYNLLKARPM